MIKTTALAILMLVLAYSSSTAQKRQQSISKNNNQYQLEIKDNAKNIQLKLIGSVAFTEDEKAIESLSAGSSIYYKKKGDKLDITSGPSNRPVYNINGNKKTNLEEADQQLIAQCIRLLIDNGVGAEERAARLYKNGGATLVLNHLDKLGNDFIRSAYLKYLLTNHHLTNDEMLLFLNKINTRFTSDHYKAELLGAVDYNYLKTEELADAYIQTVSNIRSDFYQTNMIKRLINAPIPEKSFEQMLAVSGFVKSDYYQSEILKLILNKDTLSAASLSQIFKLVTSIKSDYYQSEIILASLKNKSIDQNRYSMVITAMQNLKSSHYQASVLKSMVNEHVKDEEEWLKLIQYAGKISSDYEKTEVLTKIASKMPDSQTLKNEFMATAKSLNADQYYGKVIRALENK
jgi:hypothetical protein